MSANPLTQLSPLGQSVWLDLIRRNMLTKGGEMQKTAECLIVFVSVDSHGRPLPVTPFVPATDDAKSFAGRAKAHLEASRAAAVG